ncbi:hypothetical protein [Rhodococcus pyridinivorans]|uniref:hypothetical protein n=1 Tax=Rhodococcus pyridinivorans TaxID=103816 RepID=UPI002078B234|nr:hypothetical protein [Rhodococcus pyridinivorans]USI89650.1 hypothetical protein LLA01_19080 [Rhodococcus pyridinivorans]
MADSKWRRRVFDAVGVTEFPPGPNLARIGRQKVYVTRPGFDNIGEILGSMDVEFEPFDGNFDCSLLFVNCGTPDRVDAAALAEFVREGGCVYASDHADGLITEAFPGVFEFGGHAGSTGTVQADVIDPELRDILGSRIDVEFDTGAWTVLLGGRVETLLASRKGSQFGNLPLMAYAEVGKGAVFYTCFHNKAQTSEREKRLLQLLVVKQFSAKSHQSFEQAGRSLGLSMREIKKSLRR